LEMDRDHVGAVVLGDSTLDDMRGIIRASVELEGVQHVDLMTSLYFLALNQRASSRASSPLPRRVTSAPLTASHKATLSLANAIPSCPGVGPSSATAKRGRSFTSHEITGCSLMTRPIRPTSRSSRAVAMPW